MARNRTTYLPTDCTYNPEQIDKTTGKLLPRGYAGQAGKRARSRRDETGTDITLAALMRLYGMKPKPTEDGTWEARHPTARRRDAVVHINADLTHWQVAHPFVDRKHEGGIFGFVCWMESCGMLGVAHMVREVYPRLLAEAGIPEDYGLDVACAPQSPIRNGWSGFAELRRDEEGC